MFEDVKATKITADLHFGEERMEYPLENQFTSHPSRENDCKMKLIIMWSGTRQYARILC